MVRIPRLLRTVQRSLLVLVLAAAGCPAPFDVPLADLGIPTLADADPGILGALQNAAENGLGG